MDLFKGYIETKNKKCIEKLQKNVKIDAKKQNFKNFCQN